MKVNIKSVGHSAVWAWLLILSMGWATNLQAVEISYKAGKGTTISTEDENNSINISGRVQLQYEALVQESAENDHRFHVKRGKLKFKGHVYSPKLQYTFQTALGTKSNNSTATVADVNGTNQTVVTSDTNSGLFFVEDAFIDWSPFKFLGVQFGQFKVPFLKEQLTSSGNQQFVDRSHGRKPFDVERDIGVSLHGDVAAFNYNLFMFNGEGMNKFNANSPVLFGARGEYAILGKYEHSQSDVKHSEDVNLGVGLAYLYNQTSSANSTSAIAANQKASHGTFDIGFMYKGWSALAAMMMSRTHSGTKLTNLGFNAAVGYFVIPKKLEVAVRGDGYVLSDGGRNEYEYGTTLNYFIKEHPIKVQADYGVLLNDRGQDLNDHRFRLQTQVVF